MKKILISLTILLSCKTSLANIRESHMKKSLLAYSLIFISNIAHSSDVAGKIHWIEAETKNNEQALQIRMKGDNLVCTHENAKFNKSAYLNSSAPNFETILKIAIASYLADKEVIISAKYDKNKGDRCIIWRLRFK